MKARLNWLIPQEKSLLLYTEKLSQNIQDALEALGDMVTNFIDIEDKRRNIKRIEDDGDLIARRIFEVLNKTFITPIDREDISTLASALDDILDFIDAIADRIVLYKIEKPTQHMVEIINIIRKATSELHCAILTMKKLKNYEAISKSCFEVSRMEHETDTLYRKAIAELFESKDPIEIIKLKDIYEELEELADRCEDVADVVEDIVVKNL